MTAYFANARIGSGATHFAYHDGSTIRPVCGARSKWQPAILSQTDIDCRRCLAKMEASPVPEFDAEKHRAEIVAELRAEIDAIDAVLDLAGEARELPRCPHCNVRRFVNPNADPALDGMAHLCWKCVKPVNPCDGEDCESYGEKRLRHMLLCLDCYGFYRRQDAADADYEDYVFGRDSE